MRLFAFYLKLQLKKCISALPMFIGSVLVFGILLVFGMFFANKITENTNAFERVQVAVVVPDESKQTKQVLSFVQAMESVEAISDFQVMSSEEATQKMEAGLLDVQIEMSPDFYNDVNEGTNSPITVRMTDAHVLSEQTFRELLQDGVALIQVTEASIYSISDNMRIYETKSSISEMEDLFTQLFVFHALQRGETFKNEIVGLTGTQELTSYYISLGLLLLLCMFGMCFGFLYSRDEFEIMKLLQGSNPWMFSAGKTITIAILFFALEWICYGGLQVASLLFYWDVFTLSLRGIGAMAFLAVGIATFIHMMYAIFKRAEHGSLAIFLFVVMMCMISGVLVPFYAMPNWLLWVQKGIPITIWQQFFYENAYQGGSLVSLFVLLILSLIFEMVGVFCLCRRK